MFQIGFPKIHRTQHKTETRKSKMNQILRRQANIKDLLKVFDMINRHFLTSVYNFDENITSPYHTIFTKDLKNVRELRIFVTQLRIYLTHAARP